MIARHMGRVGPAPRERITAVLGPTNTGKTHFAVERMLAHRSGMIGLPLRLLAREVYDKIVRIKGPRACALVTGEEKIVPPEACYFVCTVEAMPLDLKSAFLAVDEIQLCADPERGHIFTDRLLYARGEEETMFLGAETMRGAIGRFVPQAAFLTRPRFSDLTYSGHKKLTRLPRRSAIVAFSADDVYGIAELVRRQRGGAAVVLGALSPRTRNAQVGLYQSGDVDFLVATDAIGMGLNMDVDHVAFASLEKFDGATMRALKPDELGQIAGRAGRHMNDGTFGISGDVGALDEEIVARIETHRYEPHRVLQWRNSALEFRTLNALVESLDRAPPMRGLAKARPATDLASLRLLAADEDVRRLAAAPAAVKTLWDACQLPDFRKLAIEDHTRLVGRIFRHLMSVEGVLPEDWLARQIARLDNTEGDVATLSGRLAQIRTWTYAANRPGWIADQAHWQNETRAVEERLSDALHEGLTQRFVDRRTAILLRTLREDETPELDIDESGAVSLGGEMLGKIDGFRFLADTHAQGIHGRSLRAAVTKGLQREFLMRAQRLAHANDHEIALSEHGRFWWDGAIVARLARGTSPLEPVSAVIADDHLSDDAREMIVVRLRAWLARHLTRRLGPLLALRRAADAKPGTTGALVSKVRGIAHQLCEGFGNLDRRHALLPADESEARRALAPFGVRFTRRSIYFPELLRPDAAGLFVLLWGAWTARDPLLAPPAPGTTSFAATDALPDDFLAAAGYRRAGPRAVRIDILERVERQLERAVAGGEPCERVNPGLLSLLGCDAPALGDVLKGMGWTRVPVGDAAASTEVWRRSSIPDRPRRPHKRSAPAASHPATPFAGLARLIAAD